MESYQECEAQIELAESLVLFSGSLSCGAQSDSSTMSRTMCGSTHEASAPIRPGARPTKGKAAAVPARIPTLPHMKAPAMPKPGGPQGPSATPQQSVKVMPHLMSLPSASHQGSPAGAPIKQCSAPALVTAPALAPLPAASAPKPNAAPAPAPAAGSVAAAAAPAAPAQQPKKPQEPPKGLLKDKDEYWVTKALKNSQPGTFAVLQSGNNFSIHCIGQCREPYVCQIHKVEGKDAWTLEHSPAVEYPSVNDIVDSLASCGVCLKPLDTNTQVSNDEGPKSKFSKAINDALGSALPMKQALSQLVGLVDSNKEEADKILVKEPRVGEFLVAAGCSLVSS